MATEMSLRVGERIRQRRQELGIRTQRELADLIPVDSVTNQTINKWEKGANEPSARYKALLAQALQVDVSYFIRDDEPSETPDPFAGHGGTLDHLERIERKLDLILTALGVEDDPGERVLTGVEKLRQAVRASTGDPQPRAAKRAPKRSPRA